MVELDFEHFLLRAETIRNPRALQNNISFQTFHSQFKMLL